MAPVARTGAALCHAKPTRLRIPPHSSAERWHPAPTSGSVARGAATYPARLVKVASQVKRRGSGEDGEKPGGVRWETVAQAVIERRPRRRAAAPEGPAAQLRSEPSHAAGRKGFTGSGRGPERSQPPGIGRTRPRTRGDAEHRERGRRPLTLAHTTTGRPGRRRRRARTQPRAPNRTRGCDGGGSFAAHEAARVPRGEPTTGPTGGGPELTRSLKKRRRPQPRLEVRDTVSAMVRQHEGQKPSMGNGAVLAPRGKTASLIVPKRLSEADGGADNFRMAGSKIEINHGSPPKHHRQRRRGPPPADQPKRPAREGQNRRRG